MFHDHWWYCGGLSSPSSKDVYFPGLKLWSLILAEGDLGPVATGTTCYFVGGFAMRGVSGVTCLKALRFTWCWVLRLKKTGPCYMLHSLLGDPLFIFIFISNTSVKLQCSLNNSVLNLPFLDLQCSKQSLPKCRPSKPFLSQTREPPQISASWLLRSS